MNEHVPLSADQKAVDGFCPIRHDACSTTRTATCRAAGACVQSAGSVESHLMGGGALQATAASLLSGLPSSLTSFSICSYIGTGGSDF